MNNLIKRALSGAVYVALIICAIMAGGWWFIALSCLFGVLALNEFYGLSNGSSGGENVSTLIIDIAGGFILVAGLGCVDLDLLSPFTTRVIGGTLFMLYLLYLVVRLVSQLYSREVSPLVNLAFSYMGQLYIALPLGLMSMYYTFRQGEWLLLAMFVMIWLSDTGAYLVGSAIGRHKLFPRISPGKTWEGFIGGLLFATGAGVAFKYLCPGCFDSMPVAAMAGMGVVVSLFATWGDLVESLIKRTLGVKDSGSIMPGHGGILDRIDSLLLVVPASLIYLVFINTYLL